jgi:predicted Zn-dependent protease
VKTFSLHNFYTDPNYPDASNVYDSLGEAYMVSGDKILAIDNYEESLAPDPDSENAKQQLEALRGQEMKMCPDPRRF